MTARDRALAATTRRLETTRESQLLRRAIQQPALYSGAGRVKALGAAGGIPARKQNSTGGISVGEAVSAAQSVITALPDAVNRNTFETAINEVLAQVSLVRNFRGIKTFFGDPNDPTGVAYQSFNYQLLYSDDGALYYWEPSDGVNSGSWVPILQLLVDTAIPTANGRLNGALHLQVPASGDPVLRVWREATTEWLQISGGGSSSNITFSTDPPPFPTTGNPSNGDRWQDTTVDRLWTYDETADLWRPSGSKTFYQIPPSTNLDAYVDGDRLMVIDSVANPIRTCDYVWVEALNDWQLASCCPNCPADPPPAGSTCDPPDSFQTEPNGQWECTT